MIPGIPTIYQDRRYRSRLEARWACFFDLVGWKYEYEPYDLNGWIPDFAIFGTDEILIEVKPYSKFEEFNIDKIIAAIEGTEKWGKTILLLGSTTYKNANNLQLKNDELFISESQSYYPIIGWLAEYWKYDERLKKEMHPQKPQEYVFGYAVIMKYESNLGFYHSLMDHSNRKDKITGEGQTPQIDFWVPQYDELLKLWNQAGNKTQWQKKNV